MRRPPLRPKVCASVAPIACLALGFGLAGCGQPTPQAEETQSPIFGGTPDTSHNAVMALIDQLSSTTATACTGTTVSLVGASGIFLTAGHCVVANDGMGHVTTPLKLADPNNLFVVPGPNWQQSVQAGLYYGVAQVAVHPQYDGSVNSPFDVAVVRFLGALPATPVIPALAAADDTLAVGSTIDVVGFGKTQTNAMNATRFEVNRVIQSITANQFLYDQTDMKGACQGDSGGPALVDTPAGTRVAGVTSFGDPDCTKVGASVRISPVYASFIQAFVGAAPRALSCNECALAVGGAGQRVREPGHCLRDAGHGVREVPRLRGRVHHLVVRHGLQQREPGGRDGVRRGGRLSVQRLLPGGLREQPAPCGGTGGSGGTGTGGAGPSTGVAGSTGTATCADLPSTGAACDACVQGSCCTQAAACANDPTCLSCYVQASSQTCRFNTALTALNQCLANLRGRALRDGRRGLVRREVRRGRWWAARAPAARARRAAARAAANTSPVARRERRPLRAPGARVLMGLARDPKRSRKPPTALRSAPRSRAARGTATSGRDRRSRGGEGQGVEAAYVPIIHEMGTSRASSGCRRAVRRAREPRRRSSSRRCARGAPRCRARARSPARRR